VDLHSDKKGSVVWGGDQVLFLKRTRKGGAQKNRNQTDKNGKKQREGVTYGRERGRLDGRTRGRIRGKGPFKKKKENKHSGEESDGWDGRTERKCIELGKGADVERKSPVIGGLNQVFELGKTRQDKEKREEGANHSSEE